VWKLFISFLSFASAGSQMNSRLFVTKLFMGVKSLNYELGTLVKESLEKATHQARGGPINFYMGYTPRES